VDKAFPVENSPLFPTDAEICPAWELRLSSLLVHQWYDLSETQVSQVANHFM
jgi:hypothetical protein